MDLATAPRSKARAIVHLVDLPVCNIHELEASCPGITCYLQNGDIVEFLQDSGYRSQGIKMVYVDENKCTQLVDQNIDCDDYGSPSNHFVVLKDFPPRYWNHAHLLINDKFAPGQKTKFYWHSDRLPVTLNKELIEAQVRNVVYELKHDGVVYPYVVVEYSGEKYGVILTDNVVVTIKPGGELINPVGHSVNHISSNTVPAANWIALTGIFE
jgi:hypothetical protein